MRLSRLLSWLTLAAMVGGIVLPIVAQVWAPVAFYVRIEAMLQVLWAGVGCGLAAASCAFCAEQRKLPTLMWFGIGASCVAFVTWSALAWTTPWPDADEGRFMRLLAGPISIAAAAVAVIAVTCRFASTSRAVVILRRLTMLAVLATAGCYIAVLARYDMAVADDIYGYRRSRLMRPWFVAGGVGLVLSVLGLLVTALVGSLPSLRSDDPDAAYGPRLSFDVTCPRCGTRQTLSTGGASCRDCGLNVKVVAT